MYLHLLKGIGLVVSPLIVQIVYIGVLSSFRQLLPYTRDEENPRQKFRKLSFLPQLIILFVLKLWRFGKYHGQVAGRKDNGTNELLLLSLNWG
ncbi:uncharacterized protein LOC113342031 isoform X6 [Papaver somniferum]|uniref:uncharacterized protein LOC113342031 isoform X6 n=1 Tax=Papaver somniferum TaxID=3469 RepID=UPI000E70290D|nr:uncharacterized protein LOC113342031 isoform X6 [Papaver somniferum]